MKIKVSKSRLVGEISVPGSKSHTIRAIMAALMADGTSTIQNPLVADDTLSCLKAAQQLGAKVDTKIENGIPTWEITSEWSDQSEISDVSDVSDKTIFLGNSGTSTNLLCGLLATTNRKITIDGDSSLRSRPMDPLICALQKLGAKIIATNGKYLPLTIQGPITCGKVIINGISSQFISSLLLATPLANGNTEIIVENLNEKPYLEITLDWLNFLGIKYEAAADFSRFLVKGNQKYKPFTRNIPADFSTATFPLIAAAVTDGDIKIKNLDFTDKQGDKEIFNHLKQMGLKIDHCPDYVEVSSDKKLIGGQNFDLNPTPDALPAMAVVSCFAEGKTTLSNLSLARIKETDRLSTTAKELRKMGAKIEEYRDSLIIEGTRLKPANVDGHNDHRIIISLAIAGMGISGETIIDNANAFSVTYPDFIKDFRNLGANIETIK